VPVNSRSQAGPWGERALGVRRPGPSKVQRAVLGGMDKAQGPWDYVPIM